MADPKNASGSLRAGTYPAEERITLAETPTLRVRQLTLAAGQCVPWHYHSEITDMLVCLNGVMSVRTRDPDAVFILEPGEIVAIPSRRHHLVEGENQQSCKFLAIQGVGTYDYVPVGE